MKSYLIRYGLYAVITLVALSAIHFFLVIPQVGYEWGEVAGYLSMMLSMIFVFIGTKRYRDQVNGGVLSFGQGLKIGAGIAALPALAFGLFDILYTEVLNPGWIDDYYARQKQELLKTVPPAEAAKKIESLQAQYEVFSNPLFQFLIMAATVFIIGFIVAIISSLALRRSKPSIA